MDLGGLLKENMSNESFSLDPKVQLLYEKYLDISFSSRDMSHKVQNIEVILNLKCLLGHY